MKDIIEFLETNQIEYVTQEPMSRHTTFKIGGNAALMAFPKAEAEVAALVGACRAAGVRYLPVGNGSNLLVDDAGIDACVILLGKGFDAVWMPEEDVIFAEAGAPLMKVCNFALEQGLSGLEFAYGIPGTCGGAALMNAGAYGGEMKDVLFRCTHVDREGKTGFLEGAALALSYRHSAYEENGCIITGLYMKMKKGNPHEIQANMKDFMNRRREKQPLEYPSAGSTFKRPAGYFAGALIEECGLKGMAVGGAAVSEKHAGFVINKGGATCADVLALCAQVSETVQREKGVALEMEIKVTK